MHVPGGRGHFPKVCWLSCSIPAYRSGIAHTGRFGAKMLLVRHHEARCITFRYLTVCTISGSQLTRFVLDVEWIILPKIALKELGLRVQLGHSQANSVQRENACKDFVVIHTNGIHLVNVDYCVATRSPIAPLLRTAWWPSTRSNLKLAQRWKFSVIFTFKPPG